MAADGGQVVAARRQTGATASSARMRMLLAGRITPGLLRLAAPNLGEAAARVGFIAADAVFLGWLGADALAGVSLVFPLFLLVQMISASGFGTGLAAAVARALGSGQAGEADALAAQALWLALAAGLTTAVAMLLLGPWLWAALGAQEGALAAATAYADIAFGGIVLVWLMNLLANIVRGTGAMAVSAGAIAAGEAVHLLLSPALILGLGPFPALGVQGAAVGVLASYGTGAAVLLGYLCSRRAAARLRPGALLPRMAPLRTVLRVGLLAALNVLLMQATSMLGTALVAGFGATTLAGYGAAQRLELLQLPITFAFGAAVVTMVAANLGAGQPDRAAAVARSGMVISGAIGLVFGAIALLLPDGWMRLFVSDAAAIEAGVWYLRLIAPTLPLLGVALGMLFALLGAGFATLPAAIGALRLGFLALGAGLFAAFPGTELVWTLAAIALATAGFALLLLATGRLALRRLG